MLAVGADEPLPEWPMAPTPETAIVDCPVRGHGMCGTLPATLNEVLTVNVVAAGFGLAGVVVLGAACVGVDVADGRGEEVAPGRLGDGLGDPGPVAVRLDDGQGAVCEAR